MGELASQTGKKALAVLVLVLAAYLLFKVVLGIAMAVAWFLVVVLAIVAVVWAIRVL
jgi:F0F1-type ATP synthase assembly protein I